MRLPRWPSALAILAAAAIVVAASYAFSAFGRDDPPPPTVATGAALTAGASPLAPPAATPQADAGTVSELDRVIGVFEGRVRERDDATDLAFLGRLYLIKARRTGDLTSYDRALAALERARDVAPRYLEAIGLLASARYSLHDFTGAADLAAQVLDERPGDPEALAVAGDAALALGDVDRAEEIFTGLAERLPGAPAIDARLSQVAWIQGDGARAVALAASAAERAEASGAQPTDLAWYRGHRGALAFAQGRLDVAATSYEEALEADPASPLALGGLAQVRAAEGQTAEAIDLYRRATAAVPDPEHLAALGDLYLLAGDEQTAEDQFATVEAIARLAAEDGGVYSRVLAEFYLDHEREVATALELTTAELARRRDVHGWDAHAWALYRNGRFDEARAAADEALALGTPEAEFWYHAGLISAALGDEDRARDELARALELNPFFDPIHADEARRVLDELGGSP